MQEDKNIKKLLQQYGVEETSSTFNNNVMQQITAASYKQPLKPLLNAFILKLLKIIFILVAIALVIFILFIPFNNLPVPFSINISSDIYKQLFSFIAVFWIIMLVNFWWNKRWNRESAF